MSYALCNFTCLALRLTGAPNFRPTWRWYSWPMSLFGFLLCMGVMFWLNVWYASIAVVCLMLIIIYLYFRGPVTNWGDVTHALLYHQVRKYLLVLDRSRASHAKYWRPSYLVLTDDMCTGMLRFCEHSKKGGLLLIGCVLQGELEDHTEQLISVREGLMRVITGASFKALPQVRCMSPRA